MAKYPQPTALRIVRGNPGRRPINAQEPKPKTATATPPTFLAGEALSVWSDMAPKILAMRCLGDVDVRELATACRLQAMGDHYAAIAEADMLKQAKRPSPALWAAVKCWEKAAMKFYRFGVTPAERTRITTGGSAEPQDPFQAFQNRKRTTA